MKTAEMRRKRGNSIWRAIVIGLSVLLQVAIIIYFSIWLSSYYVLFQIGMSILAIIVIFSIYGKKGNYEYKFRWVIIVAITPIIGTCLYFLLGEINGSSVIKRQFAKIKEHTESTLEDKEGVLESLNEENHDLYGQAYYLQKFANFPVYKNTDVKYFGDTCDALESLLNDMESAEKYIFMEYHAIEDATVWRRIERILENKASAGVDVRVVFDDIGSMTFIDRSFVRRLRRKNIKCRSFNPMIPVISVFMNNRDHRKITVVDGKVAHTGGYNIADEYFNFTHPYGEWKDSGVRVEGEAVNSFIAIFMQIWNVTQRNYENPEDYMLADYKVNGEGYVIPYCDSPLDNDDIGKDVYLNILKSAKNYVYITTPYLIIDEETKNEIILCAKRGVDIRIVTPGIPDKKFVYSITRSYYYELAASGVRIYEYTPGFLHAKQFLCDDRIATVGTINLDFRSLFLHFENGCLFAGCSAINDVKADFEQLFDDSKEVTETAKQKAKLSVRFKRKAVQLLGPLL